LISTKIIFYETSVISLFISADGKSFKYGDESILQSNFMLLQNRPILFWSKSVIIIIIIIKEFCGAL